MKEFLGESSSEFSDDDEEGEPCARRWECEHCRRVFDTYTEALVHERRAHLKPTCATRIALQWRRFERRRAARVLVRWARRWSLRDAWQWDDADFEAAIRHKDN